MREGEDETARLGASGKEQYRALAWIPPGGAQDVGEGLGGAFRGVCLYEF